MSKLLFTGERLHKESPLFAIDLVRHRAAYIHAIELAKASGAQRILDLGCGTGYGTGELAEALPQTFAVDRISPDSDARHPAAHFVRADAGHLPLRSESFDMVVSFQVIEHLEDPTVYLDAMSRLVRPGGTVLITTPNILTSDRVNPFHIHEYESDELKGIIEAHFGDVEMRGIGMTEAVRAYHDARLTRIASIMRLDVLGLHRRLPRPLIEWAFGALAKVVRRGVQRDDAMPTASVEDFPVGPPTEDDIDLLAICRAPRA